MASRAFIPITDHNDGETCTESYTIRYKLDSQDNWTTLTNQQVEFEGSPAAYGLVLNTLQDDVTYDYEITRICCGGLNSAPVTGTFVTTP